MTTGSSGSGAGVGGSGDADGLALKLGLGDIEGRGGRRISSALIGHFPSCAALIAQTRYLIHTSPTVGGGYSLHLSLNHVSTQLWPSSPSQSKPAGTITGSTGKGRGSPIGEADGDTDGEAGGWQNSESTSESVQNSKEPQSPISTRLGNTLHPLDAHSSKHAFAILAEQSGRTVGLGVGMGVNSGAVAGHRPLSKIFNIHAT